ncbi:anti-sigma factor family protein [Actinomadura gamaensis]|uniref:Anti-sigma factor family protein n=1 Tax=Actinomadura gamaensis TaxID=1763541 RepID=A0ABV9U0Z4_9ACTN
MTSREALPRDARDALDALGPHVEIGAYALGLLDGPDRRGFEAHLAGCPRCRDELGALRGVAEALDGLPPELIIDGEPAEEPDATVVSLLRRRVGRARRRQRTAVLTGIAAGIVLLAGAVGTGVTIGDRHASPGSSGEAAAALLAHGRSLTASDPSSGVAGTVALEPKDWGSRVALRLTRSPGPLECDLVAVDRSGVAHPVAGWSVPTGGYGGPSGRDAVTLTGATGLYPPEIVRFEVRTPDRRPLLSLPA